MKQARRDLEIGERVGRCVIERGDDVQPAHLLAHAGLPEHRRRLRLQAGDDAEHALLAQPRQRALQRDQAGHVHRGHRAEIEDEHFRPLPDGPERVHRRFGRAEEERAVHLVQHHLARQLEPVVRVLLVHQLHRGHLRHAPHEEEGGEDHSRGDRHHHVEDDSQRVAGEQHGHVALGRDAQHVEEVPRVRHVPRHHHEERGQRGHGQEGDERRQKQHREQDHAGVDHGGNGRTAAVADAGRGARDGAGAGDAAEKGAEEIAHAERHQLAVGIVAGAGHRVGHHRGEQRLDRSEQRDGDGRREQRAKRREPQRQPGAHVPGQDRQRGQPRDSVHLDAVDQGDEAGPDGRDLEM